MDSRISTTLAYFFVVMIFGPGMPLLYVIFFIYLVSIYLLDKYLIFYFHKLTPKYDIQIHLSFIKFAHVGIALHLLFVIWTYGNPNFFSTEFTQTEGITNKIKERICSIQGIITIIFGIVLLIIRLINLIPKVNNCLNKAAREKDKEYFSNHDICLALPLKSTFELLYSKLIILFSYIKEDKKVKNDENGIVINHYMNYLLNSFDYTYKMFMFKTMFYLFKEGSNQHFKSIKNKINFDKLIEKFETLDEEMEGIFSGDSSYNLFLIDKFKPASQELLFW
jgi:hypothetical protein